MPLEVICFSTQNDHSVPITGDKKGEKAAREAAEQPAEKASDVPENTESEKEEAAEVSNSNVKNAEGANTDFSCELCDFKSTKWSSCPHVQKTSKNRAARWTL